MTLGQFLDNISREPIIILFYFASLLLIAVLAGILSGNQGHTSPWKFIYSMLIYLVCIPGIFAASLSIYMMLFEKQKILDINIYTQILPLLSMIATIVIIRKKVSLDHVPGFDKLSGLVILIACIITLLWIMEKMRILVITYIPIVYFLLFLLGILVLLRYALKKISGR